MKLDLYSLQVKLQFSSLPFGKEHLTCLEHQQPIAQYVPTFACHASCSSSSIHISNLFSLSDSH